MIGARIRQARLLAGMSQQDVADALGRAGITVSREAVTGFERGEEAPNASVLMALSRRFVVPPVWLMHEPKLEIDWQGYRKRSALPAKTREAIEGYARDVAELQLELHSLLYPDKKSKFPEERIPVTNPEEAEEAAGILRKAWGLGDAPINNLTRTAEDQGVVVIDWPRQTERFDGLSGWGRDEVPVVVTKRDVAADRKRFNLAHELGHLVMQTPADMPVDQTEKLANRFAGALLVPAEVARRELGGEERSTISFDELGALKQRYGLSMQSWVYRAKDLGIVSPGLARSFWLEVSRRGWRKSEPFDFIGDEEPALRKQMISRALVGGLVSGDRILQALPKYEFPSTLAETTEFPTAAELAGMSFEEREVWIKRSFELSKSIEFEIFEAFGEEEF